MKPGVRIAILVAVAAIVGGIIYLKQVPPADDRATGDVPATAPTTQSAGTPSIVCLGAGKCVPCKAMEPVREALKQEYAGSLTVTYHDVWKNPQVGDQYHIRGIPTTIFFDAAGNELSRQEGFMSREDIVARFGDHGIKLRG